MHRHRRRVVAVVITALGLLGLFIFSLLYLPNQQFDEEPSFANPPSIPVGSQSNNVTPPPQEIEVPTTVQNVIVLPGDSLALIFRRLHLSPNQTLLVAKLPLVKAALKKLRSGQTLAFSIDPKQQLLRLSWPISNTDNIVISKTEHGFSAKKVTQELNVATKVSHFAIHSDFNIDGAKAHIPSTVLANLAKIYSWRLNFKRNIHAGDQFTVAYERLKNMKTQRTEPGNIIAALYQHKQNKLYALRYRDSYGRAAYYDASGRSLSRAFLRRPVNIGRISSPFSLHRLDPVLKKVRPHTGTDFAAPYGTPIHATGDGRIILRGRIRGYGRCIVINHGHGITTLYGHMSRYNAKHPSGSYVKMDDVIGYIGTSGWSTGPHVHYEYRVHHHYENPMTVKLPYASTIPRKERAAFKMSIDKAKQQLQPAPVQPVPQ
jgi:murein DD-endopeptidase MepM/ murein hydrolase activator NlpD